MSYTYPSGVPVFDYTRLLIPDTTAPFIFDDDEINMFIYQESAQALYVSGQAVAGANSVNITPQVYEPRLAASQALRVIASRLSQQAALEQLLDVKLACATAAAQARADAKELRDQVAERGDFAIAEMVNTPFAARERVYNQLLRVEGN